MVKILRAIKIIIDQSKIELARSPLSALLMISNMRRLKAEHLAILLYPPQA